MNMTIRTGTLTSNGEHYGIMETDRITYIGTGSYPTEIEAVYHVFREWYTVERTLEIEKCKRALEIAQSVPEYIGVEND